MACQKKVDIKSFYKASPSVLKLRKAQKTPRDLVTTCSMELHVIMDIILGLRAVTVLEEQSKMQLTSKQGGLARIYTLSSSFFSPPTS